MRNDRWLKRFLCYFEGGGIHPDHPTSLCVPFDGRRRDVGLELWKIRFAQKRFTVYARNSQGSLGAPIEDRLSVRGFRLFNGSTSPELIQYRWWWWWWWRDIFPAAEGRKGRIEDKSLLMHAFSILGANLLHVPSLICCMDVPVWIWPQHEAKS